MPLVDKLPAWIRKAGDGACHHIYLQGRSDDDPAETMQFLNSRLWTSPIRPEERVSGVCRLDAVLDGRFTRPDHTYAIEGTLVVFGWRVETRSVPPVTIETEARRRMAEADGSTLWNLREMKAEVKRDLMAKAIPNRKVIACFWHVRDGWLIVNGGTAEVDEVRRAFDARVEPLSAALTPINNDRLGRIWHPTNIRRAASVPAESNRLDDRTPTDAAWSDFLLWLRVEQGERSWGRYWTEGESALIAPVQLDDKSKAVRPAIKISESAAADPATLAEGGFLTKLRVTLDEGDYAYSVTLSVKRDAGLCWGSIALPKPTDPPGDDVDLDTLRDDVLFIRLRDYQRLCALLQELVVEWAIDRLDLSRWQRVIAAARVQVGDELKTHGVSTVSAASDEPDPDENPPAATPDDSRDDDGADSHPRQPQTTEAA